MPVGHWGDHKGRHAPYGQVWKEEDYFGYGEFGGKDFYELLAEINGLESDRGVGIDLFFEEEKSDKNIVWPVLTQRPEWKGDFKTRVRDCPYQGYFYDGCEGCFGTGQMIIFPYGKDEEVSVPCYSCNGIPDLAEMTEILEGLDKETRW